MVLSRCYKSKNLLILQIESLSFLSVNYPHTKHHQNELEYFFLIPRGGIIRKKPDQMFHILVQARLRKNNSKLALTEKHLFLCCVWLSKALMDVVWLPQAPIDDF